MVSDLQLARDFWLHEFPCWELATPSQVARAQETSQRVLQPIRNRFGPVYVTSWIWWSDGCVPRSGSHAQGGTVDLVVSNGRTREAWEWGTTHLLPSGYIGRWIYEPETPSQGEHIHVAPRADMVAAFGDPKIQSLEELPGGGYRLAMELLPQGTFDDPFRLDPINVVATAGIPWWAWLGVLFGFAVARPSGAWTVQA